MRTATSSSTVRARFGNESRTLHAAVAAALAAFVCLSPATEITATAAALTTETLRAWEAYVAATEQRVATELSSDSAASPRFFAQDFAPESSGKSLERVRALAGEMPLTEMRTFDRSGQPFAVPGGTIVHWRGTVFVPGVTLDRLLTRAQHPSERGPFPPDVLALRVLDRRPDALTLYIKMTRQKIVTVTYNSEHAVTYRRHGPTRASSRSVATRIAEIEQTTNGERERPQTDDHGFLWRLNSYWRYEAAPGGVLVEMESLSLSRGMPLGAGALAWPIVNRIARESIERALVAFRTEQLRPEA
jgi:hypothetical protein